MYKWYWSRMCRLGNPCMHDLHNEWHELLAERVSSNAWWAELGDVIHTLLRMVHPRLGVLIIPVVHKHALRERRM